MNQQTLYFKHGVYVASRGTAASMKEGQGPIGSDIDQIFDDLYCGEKNWDQAERTLMRTAVLQCLQKKKYTYSDVDLLLAGDLNNQIVASNYFAREMGLPYFGLFTACSASMATVTLASVFVDGGFARRVVAATSSHNGVAERQFRNPTEYGAQKPPSATFTVTGAGALLLTNERTKIRITHATVGKIVDMGMTDPNDMGSAMAPAAADTMIQHFKDLSVAPSNYDLIVTVDLSGIGMPICKKLLQEQGYDLGDRYDDCGLIIYDPKQDTEVFAGGSGCACSAVTTYAHLLKKVEMGQLKKIFVVATGALMSPLMTQQKATIPCIAHGVGFEHVEESG